ncbi:hypothetical protein DPMN_041986 [Dreissena polymorpha]|uniref:Uncharacterized protein n=1 Tax=Dreissena polymorpha TaxID=45954 RepID=A0A9D4CZZ1_DREPO|nr:hypothetical protein DPMN_041986 [Dreissena polymorpha]
MGNDDIVKDSDSDDKKTQYPSSGCTERSHTPQRRVMCVILSQPPYKLLDSKNLKDHEIERHFNNR